MTAALLRRRAFLAWFTGAAAALVVAPAEAKPRPRTDRYVDVYRDRY